MSTTPADREPALGALEDLAVELIRWPEERARHDRLRSSGVPCLLLVTGAPPDHLGIDEDWIRLPCDESDLVARARRLHRRAVGRRVDKLQFDPDGVLRASDEVVVLSEAETALLAVLLAEPGRTVARRRIEDAVWPDTAVGSKAVDALVYRLRRRLSGLGLTVRAVRGRGFVIDVDVEP
jgi:two-component system, OmpR family, response regulator